MMRNKFTNRKKSKKWHLATVSGDADMQFGTENTLVGRVYPSWTCPIGYTYLFSSNFASLTDI